MPKLSNRWPGRGRQGRTTAAGTGRAGPTAAGIGHAPPGRGGAAGAGILRGMRLSKLFFTTLRDDPADAEMASHRLLVRAGYVRQLGAGIYSLLPLGFRVTQRVEQVIREEMDRIGSQEMEMPVVHPADLWRESGRYQKIGPELVRFKDRGDRDMVLAMTHEEVVAILLRDIVRSYRQLPADGLPLPDQVPGRAALARRPHPRPRVRHEGRLQLRPRRRRASTGATSSSTRRTPGSSSGSASTRSSSGADVGIMGGSGAHEFMFLNEFGEDTLVICDSCGYAANQQIAVVGKPEVAGRGSRGRWRRSPRPGRRPSRPWPASWTSDRSAPRRPRSS